MGQQRRVRVRSKATALVEKKLNQELYSFYLDPEDEEYERNIQIFKFLFNQEDPDYKLALWNLMDAEADLPLPGLSTQEWEFLQKKKKALADYQIPQMENINKSFTTDRLRLRPADWYNDLPLYHKHLRQDGDFTLFTTYQYSGANLWLFGLEHPFFFVVEEKKSHRMVGYVGLRWQKDNGVKTGVMECEYYIFKPDRNKGYAQEAFTALCQRAFSGKLLELVDTDYLYVTRKQKAKVQVIRATIRTDNIPSCRFIESCGFQHMGTLQRHIWVENKYSVNAEIYELTK